MCPASDLVSLPPEQRAPGDAGGAAALDDAAGWRLLLALLRAVPRIFLQIDVILVCESFDLQILLKNLSWLNELESWLLVSSLCEQTCDVC